MRLRPGARVVGAEGVQECVGVRAQRCREIGKDTRLRDVALDETRLAAVLSDQLSGLFALCGKYICYHDPGAFTCENQSGGAANAYRATCN